MRRRGGRHPRFPRGIRTLACSLAAVEGRRWSTGRGPMPTVGLADQRIDEVRTTRSTSLDLSNTGLRQVPTAVRGLTYLQELRLDENQSLRELPDWLGELTELRTLDLESCGVTELPQSMARLGNLRNLRLSHTTLAVWP